MSQGSPPRRLLAQVDFQLKGMTGALQMAEAALADEWVINGDRVALQRRVLRLGKPPRRWKRPSWASVAMREPLEVCVLRLQYNHNSTVSSALSGS